MTPAVVMEYAFIPESGKDAIKLSDFRELWQGHRESVLAEDNVYISCFARGGGGAVKYIFEGRESWNGKPFFVYKHCRDLFPKMGIVVHERRPIVAVHQEVVTKDDGEVHAIVWTFAATGNFIHARFFYARVT